MLEVSHLECARADRALFRDLGFRVAPGQLLHILGRNGSGKTTLLRTLCGLTRPSAGSIRWNGTDIRELGDSYHGGLAYIGHANGFHGELTPSENLALDSALTGTTNGGHIEQALERVGLGARRHVPSKILSQGQKRRLALARLLLGGKKLWVLDEPFSALDAASVTLMLGILSEHLARGGLAILTSHQDLSIDIATLFHITLDG